MKIILSILFLSLPALALAAGDGGHGIPWKMIIYQTINVTILIGGLVYFLRKPAAAHFSQKRALFVGAAERAQAARKQAEDEHTDIKVKLSKLESTAEESVSRARAEAADLKKQMIADAEALSQRLRTEAAQNAKHEIDRAKAHLRIAMIQEAVEATREQLGGKVTKEDHQRLQGDFVQHIQEVQT